MEWIKSINSAQTCRQELNKYEIINSLIFINSESGGGGGGGGGGGANTKVPDMYGVGGVFGTQNTNVTCTLLYNKGGCPYFIPNHKSINGTFVHTFHNKIIKNYEKMTNFHSFYTNFYIFFNELLL